MARWFGKVRPMLKIVPDDSDSNQAGPNPPGESMLDAIARDGARQMLAAALQAEVAAYVDASADEVDDNGHRLVVRNGYHATREVTTAAGAVPVRAPRVNDKRTDEATGERKRFASAILPAWARKSPQVAEVKPNVRRGDGYSGPNKIVFECASVVNDYRIDVGASAIAG